NFFVDFSLPDSLKFNSELKKHNFSIQQFGNTNYSNINNEFEYTAFENGEPLKSFLVGPSNPKFSPINQISPFLRNAILCTEDGGFYYHRGFLIESIQQSIAEDIKRKKFARGGSTLTMQLVKNVFLNRNKTISRKLEEIIIVWLIENQQLCSKDRMYEVYLNIIEWGPKIYGITEASEFYFNKKPLTLSLSESIYLASIIPKPKYFKYSFDQNGELIQSAKDFITAIANKMLNKEMITESDLQKLDTKIIISDQAKSYIIPSDSLSTFETIDFNF
ncbi:MAG: penicillin-binding protein, partial [Bacteroidetes bacterium CG02_land_8_20_14_3_00_31_25]